jgi:signal transduction histidine kinase/ligand-binding sensor domain-containing protein
MLRGRMIWVTPMLELRIRCVLVLLAVWATVSMLGNVCLSAETQQTASENHSGVQGKVAALTPADYIRTDFTVEDGLLNNIIHAIVETDNGMLWIGTQSGLASFDGREFKAINLQTEGAPAQGTVHSLLESSTGDLWAATDAGVVRIPKRALDQFSPTLLSFYSVGTGRTEAESLLQTRDGVLWAGTNHGLYQEHSGKFVEIMPNVSVNCLTEGIDGHLLVTTNEGKLIEWDGHNIIPHKDLAGHLGVPETDIFEIFQDHRGTMWYSTHEGVLRRGPRDLPRLGPLRSSTTPAYRTYEDRQGNVWAVLETGVYRIIGDRIEDTPVPNVEPRCFHADREGGFWVGTNGNGLIHLKPRIVHMFTKADGLLSNIPMAVLQSHDGRLWVGCNCGLSVYDGKKFTSYAEKEGLSNSCVWSLAEDRKSNLWIATYAGGLFRFRDGRFTRYSLKQGLPNTVVVDVIVARDDSLWIATLNGVSHMQNEIFRNYTIAEGLSSNQVLSVYEDRSGTIWAATQGGIDRLVGERFVPFPTQQLPAGSLSSRFAEDSAGNLYALDSPKGIRLIRNDGLSTVNKDLTVLGMAESTQGDVWFSGTNGILRVGLRDLRNSPIDSNNPLDYEVIDRADGLNSVQSSIGNPNLAITSDNKLWVATVKGLAMVDFSRLRRVGRKPKVLVGAVVDGENNQLLDNKIELPPGGHHVELHMEAVDLASPEKIRLQYRLDGVDPMWLDANQSRTAVYTNVPTGSHAFHVRAIDSKGVWDRTGIVFQITQRPYFYQTAWFALLCLITLGLLAWAGSQWRVRLAQARAHLQMEERLSERARIARELHDTLLQSFQGLILSFQRVRNLLPGRPEQAVVVLDTALDKAERAITEGRDAIHDIRTVSEADGEFVGEISKLGTELAAERSVPDVATFRVVVEGNPKAINPFVKDEIYRIAREALRNAYGHAQARTVEAEVRFEDKLLRVRVRDDGVGIDEKHLGEAGRSGHYGLRGMRERARQIGGQLEVWTQVGAGTEIELRIPDSVAYKVGGNGKMSMAGWTHKGNDDKS